MRKTVNCVCRWQDAFCLPGVCLNCDSINSFTARAAENTILGVVATAVALFFYAKVIFYMYVREPSAAREEIGTGIAGRTVLFISAAGTMIPGVYPAPFMEMAVKAIKPFLI